MKFIGPPTHDTDTDTDTTKNADGGNGNPGFDWSLFGKILGGIFGGLAGLIGGLFYLFRGGAGGAGLPPLIDEGLASPAVNIPATGPDANPTPEAPPEAPAPAGPVPDLQSRALELLNGLPDFTDQGFTSVYRVEARPWTVPDPANPNGPPRPTNRAVDYNPETGVRLGFRPGPADTQIPPVRSSPPDTTEIGLGKGFNPPSERPQPARQVFVNVNNPGRAAWWLQNRYSQGFTNTVIRRFQVPTRELDRIRVTATRESRLNSQGRKSGNAQAPYHVDLDKADPLADELGRRGQFGLPEEAVDRINDSMRKSKVMEFDEISVDANGQPQLKKYPVPALTGQISNAPTP